MWRNWSLRFRVLLFFALIALGGSAAIAGALWVGYTRLDADAPLGAFAVAGLIAAFALTGLVAWVWLKFDENVARPLIALSNDLRARVHSDVDQGIAPDTAEYLGDLGPAAAAVSDTLVDQRNALAEAVARETQRITHQNALLEQVLRDVPAGVLLCTAEHRIALYNTLSAEIFEGSDLLGLDRPLFALLLEDPIRHAYERLTATPDEDRAVDLLCVTHDRQSILTGQMRLMPVSASGTGAPGYMLTLRDVTRSLASGAQLHTMLRKTLEDLRRPAANLSTVIAAMRDRTDDAPAERVDALGAALEGEIAALAETVSVLSHAYEGLAPEWWPLADVAASDLMDALAARCPALTVEDETLALILRCDAFALTQVLEGAVALLHRHGAEGVRARITQEPPGALIELVASAADIGAGAVETWLDQPLGPDGAAQTPGEILLRHATELWPAADPDGALRLCLPIREARLLRTAPIPPRRAEFYDFSLLETGAAGAGDDRPLTELQYIVFDTETTGLLPNQGDELVQIAAVRIVNQRILTGESLDTLVNPGRGIPGGATQIHGISEDMVADAPSIGEAVRRFHTFAGDAVLIAHNAPFDMAFLRRAEPQLDLSFTNPILDTVLLSAILYGRTAQHSLDDLTARLAIEIPPAVRHTALGDAHATAEAFLRMVPILIERGFPTLGSVIREFRKHKALLESLN